MKGVFFSKTNTTLAMKSFLLFCILLSSASFAQETIRLTYKYGRAGIPSNQQKELTKFLKKFEKLELDSIRFEGSSDSAGLFLSNYRMTEWRARNLRNYCSTVLDHPVSYSIFPCLNKEMGEVRDIRSVDIKIYPSKIVEKKKREEIELEKISSCYRVAYAALESCHIRYEKKGSKGYVYLEKYFPMSANDDAQYYYGTMDDNGQFTPKPLKWKMDQTGKNHWKKERLVAKIPEKDFDLFKIFTIANEPCSACDDDFAKNGKIEDNQYMNKPDHVVMENLQYRQPWLLKKSVVVRVPKEYVDTDLEYVSGRASVTWTEKSKHPDYYFAKVAQTEGIIDLIYRPYRIPMTEECVAEDAVELSSPKLICGPKKALSEVINFVEFGIHNQNSTNYPYAAIGAFAGTKAVEIEFLAGIHQKAAFYGAIRGRYNIINAPFSAFLPSNTWRHGIEKNRFWFAKIYVGAEYKASLGTRTVTYLEPNLNFGLSIAQNGNPTFQRFFVQYGRGVNFALESPFSWYSIFQFGFQAHLGKKEYLKERGVL